MNEVLVIDALEKTFRGKRRARVHALRGISFSVTRGEVFGFLWPNGAGKSTTIKCLMGLISPTRGRASVIGEEAGSIAARKKIGYLPENPAFYDYLSAREYLAFVGRVCGVNPASLQGRIQSVMQKLELWDARNRPMRSFSKGMVQRVGLAQAILHEPDIYVFDEPMSGLDPLGRALVKDLIVELRDAGKTVFFSTHILDDVEKVCDRVAIILGGEVKFCGEVEGLLQEGISGYHVQVRSGKDGSVRDLLAGREQLEDTLREARESGGEVLLIEPKRHNLEDFFLEIVNKN